MARSSECTGLYAQKVLDGNDIVRDGDFSTNKQPTTPERPWNRCSAKGVQFAVRSSHPLRLLQMTILFNPICRTVLSAAFVFTTIFLAFWYPARKISHLMDPGDKPGAFEPHIKRYQELARLV